MMPMGYLFPQNPARQFRREMNRLFSDFLGDVADGGRLWTGRTQPALNLWETPDALMVEAEIPGVKSDELEIAVVGPELTIKLNRAEPPEDGVTYHRRERPTGSFVRMLRLPMEVDADRVEAELANGVLLLKLPKAESAKPRKIRVNGK
jgi:HSP20 family protein